MWLNIAAALYLSTGWLNDLSAGLGLCERGATGASKPNDHASRPERQRTRNAANAAQKKFKDAVLQRVFLMRMYRKVVASFRENFVARANGSPTRQCVKSCSPWPHH